jgi:L-seryl-tRNA(Ser) seleniumtransferase
MDHEVIALDDLKTIIHISKSRKIPVMVDDASGARLRTLIYEQPRAIDLGADLVITSTDKLMEGPRAGLMSGRNDLIDKIKSKAFQFGLEAQPPLIVGIVRALEKFNPERIQKGAQRSEKFYSTMLSHLKGIEKTPTGISISSEALLANLEDKVEDNDLRTSLPPREAAMILAMLLLRKHGILTIPAVGMPGVSSTIRLDLAARDAERLDDQRIINALEDSISSLSEIKNDEKICKEVLYS